MVRQSLKTQVEEIRKWHVKDNGWSDIGYHFVVGRSGKVMAGRPLEKTGAHTIGHNSDSIGICLIGGKGAAETDAFEDHFTPAQDEAVRNLIDRLQEEHGKMSIHGHNEYAAKGCPGFQVSRWLKRKKPITATKEVQGETATGIGAVVGAGGAIAAIGTMDYSASIWWVGLVVLAVFGASLMLWMRTR